MNPISSLAWAELSCEYNMMCNSALWWYMQYRGIGTMPSLPFKKPGNPDLGLNLTKMLESLQSETLLRILTKHLKFLLTPSISYWLLQFLTDHLGFLLITSISYWPLRFLTDHFESLLTTSNSYWPLQILTDHFEFLPTTSNSYQPNSYCKNRVLTAQFSYKNCTFDKK